MSAATKPRTKLGQQLETALDAARRDATKLVKRVPGGTDAHGKPWYYAASEDVLQEAQKLLDQHKLAIRLHDQRLRNRLVRLRYKVTHLPSMESEVVGLEFEAIEPGTRGVSFALEVGRRSIRMHVLGIETIDAPQNAEPRAEVPRGPAERRALRTMGEAALFDTSATLHFAPVRGSTGNLEPVADIGAGGLIDAGELGGEDDPLTRFEEQDLWDLVTRWRNVHSASAEDLFRAAGVSARTDGLDSCARRRLLKFLEAQGLRGRVE